MKPLDIRDIAIIDSFPLLGCKKEVLNVGCGAGRIDSHLKELGYMVCPTDIIEHSGWSTIGDLNFVVADIFNLESFPVSNSDIVICSEVLEHLVNWQEAISNLMALSNVRLIITVPFEKSFNDTAQPPKGHCNYWNDNGTNGYLNIKEIESLVLPYACSISKIRTKPKDRKMKQFAYLIIIDKKQKYQ